MIVDANELETGITQWLIDNGLASKISQVSLNNLVNQLVILFSNYGEEALETYSNPWLNFLLNIDKSDIGFDNLVKNGWIDMIINLYKDAIISDKDLMDTDSIMFNKTLYQNNSQYNNLKFAVQTYYWLQNPANVQKHFGDDYDTNNLLYGKDGKTVRSADEIKKIIREVDKASSATNNDVTYRPNKKVVNPKKWRSLDLDGLTVTEADDLVTYIIDKFNLV